MRSNRHWMPAYCHPDRFLPPVQATDALFYDKPYAFPDFVGRALALMRSDVARSMGLVYDYDRTLPCKWRCADESLFQVDMTLCCYTGHFPFDKGAIGGRFNRGAIGAAVHHGSDNIDFGGSHVGYVPGTGGGSFGYIWRPQHQSYSTDCGYLMGLIGPFVEVYKDACENILVVAPPGEAPLLSVPNEFLQPSWSSGHIKLLVDLPRLTAGEVSYDPQRPHTCHSIARTLFRLNPDVLEALPEKEAAALCTPEPTPIGQALSPDLFVIFDTDAPLDPDGVPCQRILVYMNHIVAGRHAPAPLTAAIVNANLEYNHLTDTVRSEPYRKNGFSSFTLLFIDMFCEKTGNYVNLVQPVALTVKPAGSAAQVDLCTEELRAQLDAVTPAAPALDLGRALEGATPEELVEQFTFRPGHFQELPK